MKKTPYDYAITRCVTGCCAIAAKDVDKGVFSISHIYPTIYFDANKLEEFSNKLVSDIKKINPDISNFKFSIFGGIGTTVNKYNSEDYEFLQHNPNIKVEAQEIIKKSLIKFGVKSENIATYNQYTYNNKEDLDIACNMKAKEKGTKIFKRNSKEPNSTELLSYLKSEKARSQSPQNSLQARLARAPEGVDSKKMEVSYL